MGTSAAPQSLQFLSRQRSLQLPFLFSTQKHLPLPTARTLPASDPSLGVVPRPLRGEWWQGPESSHIQESRRGRPSGEPHGSVGVWGRTSASSFTHGRPNEISVLEAS